MNIDILPHDILDTADLESREYGRRDPSRWPRGTFYQQNLALISPTSGGRSVGIVRSQTQATEFSCFSSYLALHIAWGRLELYTVFTYYTDSSVW
jgi:hypothetical protein